MTAALEGGEWTAARPGRNLPPGKTRYPFYRRLDGPQGRSGRAENLLPTGIRSRTVQPVVSHYTDRATRPMSNVLYTLLISEYFMRNVDVLTLLVLRETESFSDHYRQVLIDMLVRGNKNKIGAVVPVWSVIDCTVPVKHTGPAIKLK